MLDQDYHSYGPKRNSQGNGAIATYYTKWCKGFFFFFFFVDSKDMAHFKIKA